MNFWKNYKSTIILIGSLIIGAIIGVVMGEDATILAPLGTLFMNMMFVLIVPLIFLTITTSIAKIKEPKRLGKLIRTTILVFVITSLVAVVVGLISTYSYKLVDAKNGADILSSLTTDVEESQTELDILNRTVTAISVDDFAKILSKENILALVILSMFVGIAINKVGKEADAFLEVLNSANKVVLKLVDFAFIYAPIGLGAYFANMVGTFGSQILTSYLATFIYYTIIAVTFYFVIYSLYAYIAGGKKGFKLFWKNIAGATATSISTCSSAASIPMNIKCAKGMGVSDDIAETVIPLGTSFHKDGSIIGSVFKIMFLVYLFNTEVFTLSGILQVTGIALVANLLVAAVPVGGGTISEMLIISMMGFPVAALPILTIIATIIDAPATLLNVTGDAASSMLVNRIVEGKNWINSSQKKDIQEIKEYEIKNDNDKLTENKPIKTIKTKKNNNKSKSKKKKNSK